MSREQLKKFNKIRVIAQHVENPLFQKEYKKIMLPLLEQFKNYGENADQSIYIADELNNFINAMYQKAKTFQYVPYERNKRTNSDELYRDHNKLYELEMLCKDFLYSR